MRGHRISSTGQTLLDNLAMFRKPFVKTLFSRNQVGLIEPFVDNHDFSYLGEKNNSSISVLVSSTKKRPLRLFGARLYKFKLYDLHEFDVHDFEPNKCANSVKLGSKPLVIFQGSQWEKSVELKASQNYLADLFGGVKATRVALDHFDHVYIITAYSTDDIDTKIRVELYSMALKKSANGNLPRVELSNIGPNFTLISRKWQLPDPTIRKHALRVSGDRRSAAKPKNISTSKQQASLSIII